MNFIQSYASPIGELTLVSDGIDRKIKLLELERNRMLL